MVAMYERMKTTRAVVGVGVLALAAACGDNPAGVQSDEIRADEAGFLADRMSGLGAGAIDDAAARLSVEPTGATGDLAVRASAVPLGLLRARSCPAGGSMEIEGEFSMTVEGTTVLLTFEAEKTLVDCAFEREDKIFVVNGGLEISGTRKRVDRKPSGPQETHVEGVVTISRRGSDRERTCEIDIQTVANPDTMTREITGTFCGYEVNRVVSKDG
jgi:hypothetical protein